MYTKYCTLDLNSSWEIHCLSIFPYKSLTYQSWPCRKLGQGKHKVIICIHIMMGPHAQNYIPRFTVIGLLLLEKKIFEGFLSIYGHGGHLGHVTQIPGYKLSFRYPTGDSIWNSASISPVVSEEKMFENLDDGWSDGRTLTFSDTISSSGHLVDHVYQVLYLRLK